MQAVEAELRIEGRRVVFDFFEVVLERLFLQKLVDQFQQHLGRAQCQEVVFRDRRALGVFREAGLAQRVPGEADQPIGVRQRFHPGIDGRAFARICEQPRVLERVVAVLPLEQIHHPRHIAHAADDLRVRKQPHQRRQLRRPGAIGVENHRLRLIGVIAVEQAAQEPRALRIIDHGRKLGACRDLSNQMIEQRGDRARHAGMKARVLPQDRRGQSGAGARQAGNEMECPHAHQNPSLTQPTKAARGRTKL